MGRYDFLDEEFTAEGQHLRGKPKATVAPLDVVESFDDEMAAMLAFEREIGAKLTANSLSDEQRNIFGAIVDWFDTLDSDEPEILTIGGYAGTGKTTLLCALADHYENRRVAFCALTGKAVSVLRQKFAMNNVCTENHEVSTIHRLLYQPVTDKKTGAILRWQKKYELDFDLIVIDEGSMVSEQILADFLEFGISILAVGDHGQLPPVEGQFNMVAAPDLTLEHIHRQAKDSPVLALSEEVRTTGRFPDAYTNSPEVQFLSKGQIREVLTSLYQTPGFKLDDLAVLCFSNKTRVLLNDVARDIRWKHGAGVTGPRIGDQIICLRNSYERLFNGMRGEIADLGKMNQAHYEATVHFRDERVGFNGAINRAQFGQEHVFKSLDTFGALTGLTATSWQQLGLLIDFGYALTVHKAQGSEFQYVVVYDDFPWNRFDDPDFYRRWAYTAISRCRKYLVVLR